MVALTSRCLMPRGFALQYSYLASVPLFVIYSVAMTVIKFKEGQQTRLVNACFCH